MPYKLRKAPKRDLYWVIGEDGKRHSKEPIPKERAQAQMKALYRAMGLKGGIIDRATFEWRQEKFPGYYPQGLTYEEFARAEGANEEFIKSELEKLRKQNEAYYAAVSRGEIEEDVACKLDRNLDYNRDVVPKSECAMRHEQRRRRDMTSTQRVFDDINKGLSKVADWSVENVLGNLPVVGQVVGSTYKEFAPPTSKFYKPMGEKGVAERIADAGINVAEIQKKKGEKKDDKKVEGGIRRPIDRRGLSYSRRIELLSYALHLAQNTEAEDLESHIINPALIEINAQPISETEKDYIRDAYYFALYNPSLADAMEDPDTRPPTPDPAPADEEDEPSRRAPSPPAPKPPIRPVTPNPDSGSGRKKKGGNKDKLEVVGKKAVLNPRPPSRRRRDAIAPPASDAIPLFVPFEAFDTALPPEDYAWERRKDAVMFNALRGKLGLGAVRRKFKEELNEYGLSPSAYLQRARTAAKKAGYNPKSLTFSDDDVGKLMITDDSGRKVRFGRVGYGDFLLWSAAEKKGKVKSGFAEQKRDTFQKSHSQIKGDWKSNKYSPNSLALAILW